MKSSFHYIILTILRSYVLTHLFQFNEQLLSLSICVIYATIATLVKVQLDLKKKQVLDGSI